MFEKFLNAPMSTFTTFFEGLQRNVKDFWTFEKNLKSFDIRLEVGMNLSAVSFIFP